ncbi:MAG: ZIP family metal transporter [Vicinamibacteria bacterium]
MSTLAWIVAGGVAMSVISLVGAVTLLLRVETQRRIVRPLVAFAAGSLLGGALLHMIPEAGARHRGTTPYLAVLAGFALFLAIEQFLHWHHCHRETADCRPALGYLILVGDGLHNLLGGLAVGAAFVADVRVGITIWLAAAAHEVPQELGDFGVLIHGGWSKGRALAFNLLSSATFLVGGVLAWTASARFDTSWLLGFTAGNFLYIGASDLVPEVNRHRDPWVGVLHFAAFAAGAGLLAALKLVLGG